MSVHLHLHPGFKQKEQAVLRLAKHFDTDGEVLVKGSRNIIKTNTLDGEKVNIKYFKKPGFINSLVYSFLRPTKARRSFEYAEYLTNHNILTPFPIAYIEEKNGGRLGTSYYICRHIDYDITFRELIHDPLYPERELILEQFTEFTWRMHEARINFLDHSPGNTLIVNKGNGQYDFYLIDLNRMRFEDMGIEARMDNFKKLWPSRAMLKIIARKYAELSGRSYEKLHTLLLKHSLAFKRKINKKKYLKRKLGK